MDALGGRTSEPSDRHLESPLYLYTPLPLPPSPDSMQLQDGQSDVQSASPSQEPLDAMQVDLDASLALDTAPSSVASPNAQGRPSAPALNGSTIHGHKDDETPSDRTAEEPKIEVSRALNSRPV